MFTNAVAVGKKEPFPQNVAYGISVDNFHSKFVGKVVENPDVVVADKPMNFDAGIGKFGYFPEKTHKPAWHDIFVFIPVIEDVAQ